MDNMMGENSKISSDNEVDVNIKVYPIRKRTFSAVEDDSYSSYFLFTFFYLTDSSSKIFFPSIDRCGLMFFFEFPKFSKIYTFMGVSCVF